ncbi:hypothetical protein ACIGGF_07145 [Rhodococcus sp. NPDC078407]|uniref:hypothetical protein n=1 Tax=Rhodococcus sp. NPDC078407 TaxID=3364509 RepID=UPI0037C6EE52
MLTVELASAADAATILALRHAAEDWLAARHIDQWAPREVSLSTVAAQIDAGGSTSSDASPTARWSERFV